MSDAPKIDDVLERVEPGRRAAVRKILLGPMIYAAPVASFAMDSLGEVASNVTNLYAILDIGTVGSIIHKVVSIDISDPSNISYVPFGTISGFADKYFVSAILWLADLDHEIPEEIEDANTWMVDRLSAAGLASRLPPRKSK